MRSASLAYLYSRFPVVSQTFCDTEMLAMERLGHQLVVGSINPPPSSFRHPHLARLQAETVYPAPPAILKLWEEHAKAEGVWPAATIARHEAEFGKYTKPDQRARNALYFAREFKRRGVRHIHVHFTNRATHTALFIKELTGIPFSVTAHAQDFMVDIGSRELLREMLREAQFVIAVSDFSRELLTGICPEAGERIHRVYNGQDLTAWPRPEIPDPRTIKPPLILSVGRLIEFKGFHVLIEACQKLRERGRVFRCEIAGEGPWRGRLEAEIAQRGLQDTVSLLGIVNQEQVRARLRESSAFALASLVDGKGAMDILPTVILEAMATGKPVVSTRLAGIPEMVLEGRTGLLVDPGEMNAPALAEALDRVLGNAALREEYGRAGRERLETVFSVEQTAPGLAERFQRSLDAPPAPETEFVKKLSAPAAAPDEGGPRLVYWIPTPPESPEGFSALMRELAWMRKYCAGADPQLRFAVLWGQFPVNLPTLPEHQGGREATDAILRQSRFAPDGLVLEAAWQADRQGAIALESLRQGLGPGVPTLEFLQQARLLQGWLAERLGELPGHWHTLDGSGLLSAWLARESGRAGLSTFSCTLPEPSAVYPKSLLRELSNGLSGGRTADTSLLEKLAAAGKGAWIEDDIGELLGADPRKGRGFAGFVKSLAGTPKMGPPIEEWGQQVKLWALQVAGARASAAGEGQP